MSFLLAILPQNRDFSPVFDCLRKFDIEFQVRSCFGGLAPFAENCATGQKLNTEVKKELETSPIKVGLALPFTTEHENNVEIKEEPITDFPVVLPNFSIPTETGDLEQRDAILNEEFVAARGMRLAVVEDDSANHPMYERECPVDGCSEKSYGDKNLMEHMKTHPKPLLCRECKRSCQSGSELRNHYRIHTGEKPYFCCICYKSFGRSDILNAHLRRHKGEQPFRCEFCEFKSSNPRDLKQHKRIHKEEKPYYCTFCDKRFTDSYNLDRHLRTHTGERPFACESCEYTAGDKANLRRHKCNPKGGRPYSCTECGFKAAKASDLSGHKTRFSH